MSNSLCPFLMFDGNAEAAINFYLSLFPGSAINGMVRYSSGEPGPEGAVKQPGSRLRAKPSWRPTAG